MYKDKARQLEAVKRGVRKRRAIIKQMINDRKDKCSTCGYSKCKSALEFHHVGNDKDFSISQIVRHNYGNQKILDELNKCIVLCSNCHKEYHELNPRL